MKTELEQALEWWDNLTIRVKWNLFYKYNPLIANAPANIGLNINDVEKSHIVEIWKKETNQLIDLDSEFTGALNELIQSKTNNEPSKIRFENLNKIEPTKEIIEKAAFDHTESLLFPHNSLDTKTMAKRFDKTFINGIEWYRKYIAENK